MIRSFDGIFPAVVTPRDANGDFCATTFGSLVDRLYGAGVHGLYVCGNTGEGYVMSDDQRKRVTEAAVSASSGKGRVIVHVGAAREAEAVALARHAFDAGADAVSSMPPYVQGYGFPDVFGYYSRLAGATALPLFIYYIPVVTGRAFTLEEMGRLLGIDSVAGLKFTDYNFYMMEGLLAHASQPHVFNGHDEVMVAGMAMGAQAGIGSYYNILPGRMLEIYRAMREDDLAEARRIQAEVNQVIRAVGQFGHAVGMRTVLKHQGIDCGPPARPATGLSREAEEDLKRAVEETGVEIR